jgi:hypothetical protein
MVDYLREHAPEVTNTAATPFYINAFPLFAILKSKKS